MKKPLSIFLTAIIFTILFNISALSQEETLTLTAYYPSPYGIYNELRAKKMAIGDTYYDSSATAIPAGASLLIEGNVGIGTTNPAEDLHVVGDIRADDEFKVAGGPLDDRGYTFVGDENTAMFSPSSDIIGFGTAGVERMRITPSGNVGIGTTTPLQQLTLTGNLELPISTATTGIIYMADNSTNPPTEYKFIQALATNENTFVGINSGFNAPAAATHNTAVGYKALSDIVSGDENTAVGWRALQNNTSGYSNTAVGQEALRLNTGGDNNTAVGFEALESNENYTYLEENTAVGTGALRSAYRSVRNTAVGGWALSNVTPGDENVAIGEKAGFNVTTGDLNVFIGYNAGYNVTSGSNKLYIANSSTDPPLIYGDFAAKRVGINTITPGYSFQVVTGANEGHVNADGSWSVCSDLRLKKNITTLQDSLTKLSKIRGVHFDFKEAPDSKQGKGKHIGFIAQELEKEFPELVDTDDTNGYKSVAYAAIAPVLVEAIKGLKAKNEALEKIDLELKEEISALEASCKERK